MNRKLISFCLVLTVLTIIFNSSIAASSYTIDAPITSETDWTASQWYANAQSRALLTISASYDTISQISDANSDSYSSFWMNPSWVGISKSKLQVMVVGYYNSESSTNILVIIYTPSTGKIEYIPIISNPVVSDDVAEMLCLAAIQNDSTDTYEKNDASDILSIVSEIMQ